MKKIVLLIILFMAFGSLSLAQNKNNDLELPPELEVTYENFILAMKTGDIGSINEYCLPNAIEFTYEMRKDNPSYGQDINIYWVKNGFSAEIFSVRKDDEGCYLIRTATTAMWFIQTKSIGWKLYQYLDKPIM